MPKVENELSHEVTMQLVKDAQPDLHSLPGDEHYDCFSDVVCVAVSERVERFLIAMGLEQSAAESLGVLLAGSDELDEEVNRLLAEMADGRDCGWSGERDEESPA